MWVKFRCPCHSVNYFIPLEFPHTVLGTRNKIADDVHTAKSTSGHCSHFLDLFSIKCSWSCPTLQVLLTLGFQPLGSPSEFFSPFSLHNQLLFSNHTHFQVISSTLMTLKIIYTLTSTLFSSLVYISYLSSRLEHLTKYPGSHLGVY